ncbi:TetR family transcriptional regulator [Trinickia symbiotica]|uniref:TetR/AcrR family transcriptional regulator n=1 Tax=Trinickia symbiotica TaxID=863227 RepID=A0A2N7XA71_9BURK|nr:TetR/AcrR family transcriptional regulator [Trinickia symbiotica]PMS38442.1 TetR/AcrR family transcriptional regulator [Trinickia symbiotica]PPK46454.1 TetR family transcriptional regulator [Trinickia symbiotica]
MRVSKEKADANRRALLQAASKLFREKGVDGVGVAEVAKAAGLTHGALYAHFPSKDALAAEAFSAGFAGSMAGMRAWAGDRHPTFEDYLDALFSAGMRDRLGTGCPMTASASEAARQGPAVSDRFAKAFNEEVAIVEGSLHPGMPAAAKRQLAVASVAAQIGAIAVARAVAKTDLPLSDEVLHATRETIKLARCVENENRGESPTR